MERDKTLMALTVVVLLHLGVVYAHGSAHAAARVDLPPAALAFVLVVIGIGPIAGLGWAVKDLVRGADHVDHVVGPSRGLFGATGVLLVITEAAGAVLGFAHGFRPARRLA